MPNWLSVLWWQWLQHVCLHNTQRNNHNYFANMWKFKFHKRINAVNNNPWQCFFFPQKKTILYPLKSKEKKKPLFKHCSTLKQNFVCIDFLSTFKSINPISLDNPYLRPVSNTVLSWYYQQKNVNKRSSFLNGDYTDVWVEKIL